MQCGYTEADIHTADPADMDRYYSAEKQAACGVVGIELCDVAAVTARDL